MARLWHLAAGGGTGEPGAGRKGGGAKAEGSGWAQPLPLDALGDALAEARPGDDVLVGFARDRENPWFWHGTQARLSGSGLPDRPLRLSFGFRGDDGVVVAPDPATGWALLRRTEAPWPSRTKPDLAGSPLLILDGASQISLSGPLASGAPGTGLIALSGAIDGLTIRDLHLRHGGRAIDSAEGSRLTGLHLEGCSGLGLGRGFARFHSLSHSLLRNLVLDAALTDGGETRVVQLIWVGAGEDLRFEHLRLRNAVSARGAMARGSGYVQGDGVVLEADTRNARFFNCHAEEMGDAGFDLKCDGVEMSDCSTRNCKYGVRIWRGGAENRLSRLSLSAPRARAENAGACLWMGGRAVLSDCLLRGGPDSAVIRFGKGLDGLTPGLRMTGGAVETAGGSFLAGDPGEVILREVRVDGRRITGRALWDGREIRFA